MAETFFKFPRTRHIFDAGGDAVSRDDLIMTEKERKAFLKDADIIIEEKIDGANIGISINKDFQIRFQNRSHYVDKSSHKQFSVLERWQEQHAQDLFQIIEPERHILFGEWVFAKHSVHYTALPNYFIAFDIFDKVSKKFLCVKERNSRLENTSIPIIHTITIKNNPSKDDLMPLLETKSYYYDGQVEGIVLRKNKMESGKSIRSDSFEDRAKLVRSDFLQQIEEQWTRQKFEKNKLLFY